MGVDPAIVQEWLAKAEEDFACISNEPAAESMQDACEYLNTFYVEARYPVHWPTHFTLEEAERAHQAARRIKVWVEERLRSFPAV